VQGHLSHYGFDGDEVNDYENHPSSNLPSGQTTPLVGCGSRRAGIHNVQYAASHKSGLKSGWFPINHCIDVTIFQDLYTVSRLEVDSVGTFGNKFEQCVTYPGISPSTTATAPGDLLGIRCRW